jgi:sterol desaturase/sphingolipid hydroxylase (fatty acid hydroxylase superfamily)
MRSIGCLTASQFNLQVGLCCDCLISVALFAVGLRLGHLRLAPAVGAVLTGLLVFSFIEYAAHRWLFHGHTGPFERGHARHHADPEGYDALPFFFPPLFMVALAVLFRTAVPSGYALLLAGAIAAGYAVYGLSHTVIHARRFHSRGARRWAGFHYIHHYHPESNFGVTTGLWDVILGTRYKRQRRPALRRR